MSKTNSGSSSAAPAHLGLYGGSFDPIHHGHLLLARDALEQLQLEQIVFIPAARSPHKAEQEPASADDRWDLLRAALAGEPRFLADDWELRRPAPSYTIDTVSHYRALYPHARLYYFVGEDNLPELHTWKDITTLARMVTFVVFARRVRDGGDAGQGVPPACAAIFSAQPHPPLYLRRHVEISSSEIRNRVASGLSIRYMVPDSVMHLISSRSLYAS